MTKDAKIIQRGTNVQDNDLAVQPGTLQHAVNVDFYRNGVAAKRTGFESMYNGLPQYELDASFNPSDTTSDVKVQRNIWELFSRDRLITNTNGMIFAYDEGQNFWFSVPVNLSHRFQFIGNMLSGSSRFIIGRAIGTSNSPASPFYFHNTTGNNFGLSGCIANDPGTSTPNNNRLRSPFDVARSGKSSDDTSIRSGAAVIAGSITSSGSTDGTATAARFSGASWITEHNDGTIYVADNANQIRRIDLSGNVTTFAGAIAAGDVDGVGTSARFRNISGLAYDFNDTIYILEGTGAHRIRKMSTTSGSVTIFAGSLIPTPGYLDATGTLARFNSPTGLRFQPNSGILYLGDTGNNRIRAVTTAGVVTTLNNAVGVVSRDGLVGGLTSTAITPGVVLRGLYRSSSGIVSGKYSEGMYLSIECATSSANSLDLGLVSVSPSAVAILDSSSHVYHYARCPSAFPTQTTGPNKLDTSGPNAYSYTDTRAVDVGGGVAFSTASRPRVIDIWTKLENNDTMPRLRDLGIFQPEAPLGTVSTATGTTFANNTAWAYRVVFGLKLPDGRITTGPPSERIIVTNTSGVAKAGSITAYPSPGLPYDGMPFLQLYRTKTFASTLDPGDQMYLAYETPFTYGSGAVIEDVMPDANLGAELYTNQTSDGLAYSSLPPPFYATEIASFGQRLVLGNYIPQASVRVKLLGTSPLTPGISTISLSQGPEVGFRTYAKGIYALNAISGLTDPNINSFQIATLGSPSQNAAQTARNIVRCINRSPDAYFFQAFYDENEPGTFVVTSLYPGASKTQVTSRADGQTLTQSAVTFTTNTPSAFFTIGSNIATRTQNAVIYSDLNILDSFPVVYSFNVGPGTESIQRLLPISDRILAVKDDSVWSIDQTFSTQIYDAALSTNFPNSFSKLNNQWIGLFTRGFCSLNASQAVAIGRNIDRLATGQLTGSLNTTNFVSSAAIDVYGNYLCTVNDRTFVYNVISQSWSEWQINSMVAQPTDVVYPGQGIARISGMQNLGAFRDSFVVTRDFSRAMFRQRDWRRNSNDFLQNYADANYAFSGVLAADLQTITVASYSALGNPGILPPNNWRVPSGQGSVTVGGPYLPISFPWVMQVSQLNSRLVQGGVVATNENSATSAVTVTLTRPLAASLFAAGSITLNAYSPILNRLQYAPTFRPGVNSVFGDVLVTIERAQSGPMAVRSFGRSDYANGIDGISVGEYRDSCGIARYSTMSNIRTALNGYTEPTTVSTNLAYDDVQRIPTPSERSTDQQIAIELWEGAAWQPLAIKAVVIDVRETSNGKVKQ